jgi:tetratricopeptide (TPR) repeat protein
MRRLRLLLIVLVSARVASAQVDPFARVRALVGAGDLAKAKGLADSVVRATPEESPAYAEALYWRARATDDVAAARRDYLRIALEHPRAAVAEDALYRLGTAAYDRGDRATARRFLQQLATSFPDGRSRARGAFALGRTLMDEGAVLEACAQFDDAKRRAPTSDVEFRGQVAYLAGPCVGARADSAARRDAPRTDSSVTAPSPVAEPKGGRGAVPSKAATGPAWSVQVAAFASRDDAAALAKRLSKRGYDARVTVARPYRVRVGRYATRDDAVSKATKMKSAGMTAIVVEAERP